MQKGGVVGRRCRKVRREKSYKLIGLTVRSFCGVNYLSAGKDSQIENVTDIGETAELEDSDLEKKGIVCKVVEGEIDGVLYTDDYEGCIACNAKVKANDDVVAEYTKCGMLMKRSKCKKFLTACVVVVSGDSKHYMLMLFNNVLRTIIGNEEINVKRALLSEHTLRFLVDKGDVVYSVQHLNRD